MPKISVIMSVYNTNNLKLLEPAIMSILNQTFTDFEFIIYDDGSNDGTFETIRKIINSDSRVILLRCEENHGLAYGLNECLRFAKSDYIARMDADDISDIKRLELQYNSIINKGENIVVGCGVNYFDDSGVWGGKKYPQHVTKYSFLYNSPIAHASILAHKKAFEMVDGYRDIPFTHRVEDYDLFMRMFAKKVKILNMQESLYFIREDSKSINRRGFLQRINEVKVRLYGYGSIGLFPIGIPFLLKPLLALLIPKEVLKYIKLYTNRY